LTALSRALLRKQGSRDESAHEQRRLAQERLFQELFCGACGLSGNGWGYFIAANTVGGYFIAVNAVGGYFIGVNTVGGYFIAVNAGVGGCFVAGIIDKIYRKRYFLW